MKTGTLHANHVDYENPQKHRWQDSALCAQIDPEIFFPDKGGTYALPRQICKSCVVRSNCLEKALLDEGTLYIGDRFGMFGGLIPSERYALYLERSGESDPDEEIVPEIT